MATDRYFTRKKCDSLVTITEHIKVAPDNLTTNIRLAKSSFAVKGHYHIDVRIFMNEPMPSNYIQILLMEPETHENDGSAFRQIQNTLNN